MSQRSRALADRIEQGARSLGSFAESLSETEWKACQPGDGRTAGVIVHHVASMYPIEIELAKSLAAGKAIEGVTWDVVAKINAEHAAQHAEVGKAEALDLLRRNSAAAAAAVRDLTDDELDRAAAVSLSSNAPLTAQFFIEEQALRHSFHHLAKLRALLGR